MWVFIRTALIWLLAAALPFQGAVAASMVACGPGHHGGAAVQHDVAQHQSAESAGHDHSDHDHPEADAASSVAIPDSATADSEAAVKTAPKSSSKGSSKCSVCASCCTGAALPATAIRFSPPPLGDSPFLTSGSASVVFITDGPERPPRTFLA